MKIIARIYNDFKEKFGIPRQSGLAMHMVSKIVFEPEFGIEDAFRGIEEYSHLWLVWGFSEHEHRGWNPTVRPPRLGGNRRIGVFATRSSFRPNSIGLSCVQLERLEKNSEGTITLYVRGADMMSGTPIYDVKPYLPYVDAYPEARGGFAEEKKDYCIEVMVDESAKALWETQFDEIQRVALLEILSQDPRPAYHEEELRVYGMKYAGKDVKFQVKENKVVIVDIQ